MQPGKSCSSCILLFAWPGEPVTTNGKNEPNDRAILHAMSSLTATSKGAATREAILDRAYDIARFAGLEGLSIGPLAPAVVMSTKIGRASCRERGCQYVEITVGAGSL